MHAHTHAPTHPHTHTHAVCMHARTCVPRMHGHTMHSCSHHACTHASRMHTHTSQMHACTHARTHRRTHTSRTHTSLARTHTRVHAHVLKDRYIANGEPIIKSEAQLATLSDFVRSCTQRLHCAIDSMGSARISNAEVHMCDGATEQMSSMSEGCDLRMLYNFITNHFSRFQKYLVTRCVVENTNALAATSKTRLAYCPHWLQSLLPLVDNALRRPTHTHNFVSIPIRHTRAWMQLLATGRSTACCAHSPQHFRASAVGASRVPARHCVQPLERRSVDWIARALGPRRR